MACKVQVRDESISMGRPHLLKRCAETRRHNAETEKSNSAAAWKGFLLFRGTLQLRVPTNFFKKCNSHKIIIVKAINSTVSIRRTNLCFNRGL